MCERLLKLRKTSKLSQNIPASLAGRTCRRGGAQCSLPFEKKGGPGGPADMLQRDFLGQEGRGEASFTRVLKGRKEAGLELFALSLSFLVSEESYEDQPLICQ